jgi:hypothetical protein
MSIVQTDQIDQSFTIPQTDLKKFTNKLVASPFILSATSDWNRRYSNNGNTISYTVSISPIEVQAFQSELNTISNRANINSTLYPLAIRYADHQNGIYAIERPPFKINIDFSTRKGLSRKSPKILENKQIWIPWTVSVIKLGKSLSELTFKIYFNDAPLNDSTEDNVVIPWIPNVFGDARICSGDSLNELHQRISSGEIKYNISEIYTYLFNDFFLKWNSDISLSNRYLYSTFNQLGYFSKVFSNRDCPKSIDSYQQWLNHRKNSGGWINILYCLSHLSFSETIILVSKIKEAVAADNKYGSQKHNLQNIINSLTSASIENQNNSTLPTSYNSLYGGFSTWGRMDMKNLYPNSYVRASVLVSFDNMPANIDTSTLQTYSQNPKILSHVYIKFIQTIEQIRSDLPNNIWYSEEISKLSVIPNLEQIFQYHNLELDKNCLLAAINSNSDLSHIQTTIDWNTL